MSAKSVYLASVLFMYLLTACSAPAESPQQTIDNFYKLYLGAIASPYDARPELKYSTSLLAEMAKNSQVCAEYANGLCGWDAEGDKYILSITPDEDLSYANAQLKVSEISPDVIRVQLNTNPALKSEDNANISIITYKMIQEGGVWVADDIFYGEKLISVRESIKEENEGYIANPDMGSIAERRQSGSE